MLLARGSACDAGRMRVLAIADTHIRRNTRRRLPDRVWHEAEQADVILHAGDVLVAEVLDELGAVAPVHAVLGNNDPELVDALPGARASTAALVPLRSTSEGGGSPSPR